MISSRCYAADRLHPPRLVIKRKAGERCAIRQAVVVVPYDEDDKMQTGLRQRVPFTFKPEDGDNDNTVLDDEREP